MPIPKVAARTRSRVITADEKKGGVFRAMRIGRADARQVGKRQKIADQKAAEAALKAAKN